MRKAFADQFRAKEGLYLIVSRPITALGGPAEGARRGERGPRDAGSALAYP